ATSSLLSLALRIVFLSLVSLLLTPPPISPLFPYTTLFRSISSDDAFQFDRIIVDGDELNNNETNSFIEFIFDDSEGLEYWEIKMCLANYALLIFHDHVGLFFLLELISLNTGSIISVLGH